MTKRIFRSICLVALAVLIGAIVVIMGALYNYFTGVQRRGLAMQTALAAQAVTSEGAAYLNSLGDLDTRITWIAADGTVLFDNRSDHGVMENHLEREEVREALETGTGDSIRFSDTLAEQSVYTAQRLPDGTVLRLSMAQYSTVRLVAGMAEPIFLVLMAAVALALWLAHRLSRSIVKPLNGLNLDDPLANQEYEEIGPLLRRLDSQQRQLKAQQTELKRKQREFDAITNNRLQKGRGDDHDRAREHLHFPGCGDLRRSGRRLRSQFPQRRDARGQRGAGRERHLHGVPEGLQDRRQSCEIRNGPGGQLRVKSEELRVKIFVPDLKSSIRNLQSVL